MESKSKKPKAGTGEHDYNKKLEEIDEKEKRS